MSETEPGCGNCRYLRHGRCHRYAPRPSKGSQGFQLQMLSHLAWAAYVAADIDPEVAPNLKDVKWEPGALDEDVAYWPHVEESDWCGQWEAK